MSFFNTPNQNTGQPSLNAPDGSKPSLFGNIGAGTTSLFNNPTPQAQGQTKPNPFRYAAPTQTSPLNELFSFAQKPQQSQQPPQQPAQTFGNMESLFPKQIKFSNAPQQESNQGGLFNKPSTPMFPNLQNLQGSNNMTTTTSTVPPAPLTVPVPPSGTNFSFFGGPKVLPEQKPQGTTKGDDPLISLPGLEVEGQKQKTVNLAEKKDTSLFSNTQKSTLFPNKVETTQTTPAPKASVGYVSYGGPGGQQSNLFPGSTESPFPGFVPNSVIFQKKQPTSLIPQKTQDKTQKQPTKGQDSVPFFPALIKTTQQPKPSQPKPTEIKPTESKPTESKPAQSTLFSFAKPSQGSTSLFTKPAQGSPSLFSKPTQSQSLFNKSSQAPSLFTNPLSVTNPNETSNKPQVPSTQPDVSLDDFTPSLFGQKSAIGSVQKDKQTLFTNLPSLGIGKKDKNTPAETKPSPSLFSNLNAPAIDLKLTSKDTQITTPQLISIPEKQKGDEPKASTSLFFQPPSSTAPKQPNTRKASIQAPEANEISLGETKRPQEQAVADAKPAKPKVTFAENVDDASTLSLGKKTSVLDAPILTPAPATKVTTPIVDVTKPTNKVTTAELSTLVNKTVPLESFLSCKQVLTKISQNQTNKQELKQYISQKQVLDILTLTDNQTFVLNGDNFRVSQKALPNYQQTHINLKRYIFDLVCYFKSITSHSDWKCLNILENFFIQTKYYEEFRTATFSADENYFFNKKIYERNMDNTIRLSTFSSEVKKIMEMLIDEQLIMFTYVVESILTINRSFSRGELSKIFNKDQLITKYFKVYFKLLNKSKTQIKQQELSIYYKAKVQYLITMFSKFLVDFILSTQITDLISQTLLKDIIQEFDSYNQSDSALDTITNNKSEVEKNHQHILLILFNFERVKKGQNSVFEKYSSVEKKVKRTSSYNMLPFREVMDSNKIMEMEEEDEGFEGKERQSEREGYREILSHVNGHQWMHWMEVYLKEQRVSDDEYEAIVDAMDLVYTTDEAFIELFRINKNEGRIHPIYKHLDWLKTKRNHNILYRIYTILLGNQEFNESEEVVRTHIKDKEWTEYILKPLLCKFKQAALNQVVLTEQTKDTNSKILFLIRIIQLNPSKLQQYSKKLFRNNGYPIQLITFLLDCFTYYTLSTTKNYHIAAKIFSALNKLALEKTTYKQLFLAISLYHNMNTADKTTHWLLRFLPELKRDNSKSAVALRKQITYHLQIILSYQQILIILPEKSNTDYYNCIDLYKQRYTYKEIWEKIKISKVPASPWIRSVAAILETKELNYRAIGNIVRLISYKCTQLYANQVPYLNLIKDILNSLPITENLFSDLETAAAQSLAVVNSKKQMYENLRSNSIKKAEAIQNQLYLFHILLDLYAGFNKLLEESTTSNYYLNLVNDLNCLQGLQSTMSLYFNSYHQQKETHPFVSLFGFISYQKQRLLPLSNNPTLYKQYYKQYHYPSELNNKKEIDRLDYNYIQNPLSAPLNKDYTSVQSVSINIFKALTAALKAYKSKINLNQYFKRSVSNGVFQTTLNLIYQSLINFQSNRQQCIATLQFLNYVTKYQYKFVEAFFLSSNSFFTFLDLYLKGSINDIEIIQKSIQIINSLEKSSFRKAVGDRMRERDYKLMFIHKLKMFDTNNIRRIEALDIQNNATQLLERIVVNRSIINSGRFYYSVEMLVEITLISMFKGHKPLQYIETLFAFINDRKLLSTANQWRLIYPNEINRISQSKLTKVDYHKSNYLQQNNLFNHLGNYRQDPYETHVLNSIHEQEPIFNHMQAYSNNIYSFMKDTTLSCYRSIYDILILILNCGNEGYFLSTQPTNITRSDIASPLYCQFHQPKIAFSFKDVFGKNQSKIQNFIQSIVKTLLLDLNKVNPKCNYQLCLELLSVCIHTIRSNKDINSNFKHTLEQLIEKPMWMSEGESEKSEEDDRGIIVTNPLVSKIMLQLITMIKQERITPSSTTVKNFGKLISQSLTYKNVAAETKTNLLMVLLNLIILKCPVSFNPIDLITQNSVYFYSVARILIQYSKTHALELIQAGIINTLINHHLFTSINQQLIYYSDTARNQCQMSWIWVLNLISHITFHAGKNTLVANQVLKFLEHFSFRILCILDEPSLEDYQCNYAYLEELDITLKLLNVSFRTFKNMSLFAKQFLERFQYCLLHNTVRVFGMLEQPYQIKSFTQSQNKIRSITPFSTTTLLKIKEASQNLFSLSLQQILVNCLINYSSILEMSLTNSQFIKFYFQKPLQGTNIMYSNYFWLFTNKNLHNIEQTIQNLHQTFADWDSDVLNSIQKVWKSPELFSTNGYLTSIKSYWNLSGLIDNLIKASVMTSKMSFVYYQQQTTYRQKYLSLVPEDVEDFRSQQVKFIKNVQNLNRNRKILGKFEQILENLKQEFANSRLMELVYI